MPGYIAEFGGKYCLWSTVTDSPVTFLMDQSDLFDYMRGDYPDLSEATFDMRMERVKQYGCSGGQYGWTKDVLLSFNRAGSNESHIATEEEMVRIYTNPKDREP